MKVTTQKIKELMQSDTAIMAIHDPIAINHMQEDEIQEFQLYRLTIAKNISGRMLPAGAALLLTANAAETFQRLYGLHIENMGYEPVRSFVLPYFERGVAKIQLTAADIDLVITTSLTGCAVTAELGVPFPELRHLNYRYLSRTGSELVHQERINDDLKINIGSIPTVAVRAKDYIEKPRQQACAVTFMGFKTDDGLWEYHCQRTRYHFKRARYTTIPSEPLLSTYNHAEECSVAKRFSLIKLFRKRSAVSPLELKDSVAPIGAADKMDRIMPRRCFEAN